MSTPPASRHRAARPGYPHARFGQPGGADRPAAWLARVVGTTLVAVLGLGMAGCGVPDSGEPVVDGTPRFRVGDQEREPVAEPLRPEEAADSREAVAFYFQAASSQWSGLAEAVRDFVVPAAYGDVRPSERIKVVRLSSVGDPEIRSERLHRVRVRGDVVGELTEDGMMLPADGTFRYTFQLRYTPRGDTDAWLLENPPAGFVLSTEGIAKRYDSRPVYYSNPDYTASLVPDIRYLPKSVEWGKQRNMLVDWLLDRPSPWLSTVVAQTFPNGTQRRGNVYLTRGRDAVVNLTGEADPYDRKDILSAQLMWTLRSLTSGGLQLRIEGRVVSVDGRGTQPRDAYARFNAVNSLPGDSMAYYVSEDGEIETLPFHGVPGGLPAVLAGDGARYNTSVVAAALSRTGDLAAVVRGTSRRQRLWLGRARAGQGEASYRQVSGLPTGQVGQPVWVSGRVRGQLLVPAGGDLYVADIEELTARRVDVPGVSGIREVSVAPDGFRVALVTGRRLYVAAVQQRDGLAVGEPRLVTTLVSAVDVAWSQEDHLVVAGSGPEEGSGLLQVSVDGVAIMELPAPGDAVPNHVASYPKLTSRGRILVARNDRVYEIFSTKPAAPGDLDSPPDGSMPFFAT